MAEDRGEEVEVKQSAEQPEGETPPVAEAKTFTQEEVDTMISEKDKAYQGIQKVVGRKDRELDDLRRQQPKQVGSDDTSTLEIMLQDKKLQSQYGESDPMIRALENEITKRKAVATQNQQYQAWQDWKVAEREKRQHAIVDVGEDPDDPKFDTVWDSFAIGVNSPEADLSDTDKRLGRILGKPKGKTKSEDEAQRIEARAEALALEKLKKTPGWRDHEGAPSGAGQRTFTPAQIRNMSPAEYSKNKQAIDEALREGRLK